MFMRQNVNNDSPIGSFQIVIGKLDPFNNDSCEATSKLQGDNIFQRYEMSYSDLVRSPLLNNALSSFHIYSVLSS